MKKQEAIYAGLGAGVLFGLIQSFSWGWAVGLTNGVYFGGAMATLMYLFANSTFVRNQTRLPDSILLPGEAPEPEPVPAPAQYLG